MSETVLITGSSSGVGQATAALFSQNGWNVVATMRSLSKQTSPPRANLLMAELDVQKPMTIKKAIASGIGRFGRIDVVVNSAGFGILGVFESISVAKVREIFEVNVFGMMNVVRALLPHFRQNNRGLIINVSSGGGIIALPLMSVYNATKFALEGFSESLSHELASQHIGVKIIEPGGIKTEFGSRMATEFRQGNPAPAYDGFVQPVMGAFASRVSAVDLSADDVARTIFAAATDGSKQLRYLIGQDIAPLVEARHRKTESDYLNLVRERYIPIGSAV
ncbi:MAG TPA: SDR family oxidoreductase [Steroidobacteraceae bacterium]|nr:SDR family oxidoreductase [Steroidobacteraceae bacterium]